MDKKGLPVLAKRPNLLAKLDAKLRSMQAPGGSNSLMRDLRGTMIVGAVILLVFFGIGGGWAATAPLAGAVIAPGVVSPLSSRQVVQHLEGGIIREILVSEGDQVEAGELLVVISDISAEVEANALTSRLRSLAAREARLIAERNGDAAITFDHFALADMDDPEVEQVVQQQIRHFQSRQDNTTSREAILNQRIAQLEKQIGGAEQQLQGTLEQRALIREEISGVRELYEKGYERKPRLLSLQRAEADLLGDAGELESRISRSKEAIAETEYQIVNMKIELIEEIDERLTETQTERAEVEERLRQALDRLTRTDILAPVSGIVLNLRFKTVGGVVRAGEAVLDIVPSADDLIIEAQLSPNDVDEVHPGLEAYIMFPSYPQRNLKRISGRVRHVSADSIEDERSGQRYFAAKIEVDRAELKELAPQIELQPGLPAEVFIATSDRTLLDYLVQPLLQTIERSFRES